MSQPDESQSRRRKSHKSAAGGSPDERPGWADGLRQLYDSVVDEPLPDSFDDLLKKLDQDDHGRA